MDAAEFQRLRDVSARLGTDPLMTQAAGGNTSLKSGGTMAIKASGTWLRDALREDIFVEIDWAAYVAAMDAGEAGDDAARFVTRGTLRASIETPVHAVVPHAVVLHVHHIDTIAHAVCADARERLAPRLAGLSWRFVPYVKPGLRLAEAMLAAAGGERVDVYVLGNHGLVVGADTVDAAMASIQEIATRLALPVRAGSDPDLARLAALSAGSVYAPAPERAAHAVATDPVSLEKAAAGTLYPDHVIFLGPGLGILGPDETLADAVARLTAERGAPPVAIAVPGAGLLLLEGAVPAAQAMARCLADVASRIPEDAPLRVFDTGEIHALVHWDAEAYRRSLKRAGG